MTEQTQTITIASGDAREVTVTVRDSFGTAVDLTGFSIAVLLAPTRRSAPLLTKAASIRDQSEYPGEFKFALESADTDLPPRIYYMEAVATDPSGRSMRVLKCLVLIEPSPRSYEV
jgi:hypothetical protein